MSNDNGASIIREAEERNDARKDWCDNPRVYFVSDPGGYDWNARKIGVYSTLERAQQVASHDDDTEIWSTVMDCPSRCSDPSHKDRNEGKREGWIYLYCDGWKPKEVKA